jgi:hypothetical protein
MATVKSYLFSSLILATELYRILFECFSVLDKNNHKELWRPFLATYEYYFAMNIDILVLYGTRHLEEFHSSRVRHSDGREMIQFKPGTVHTDSRRLPWNLLCDRLLSKDANFGIVR